MMQRTPNTDAESEKRRRIETRDQDRSRLSGVVENSLDGDVTTGDLARRAYRSRTQFHRLFRALVDETPAAMRRRLLLERAAYHLLHSKVCVTEIALDAGYGSLEAFSRAFRRAFGASPSLYRRMQARHTRLPTANGIHFHAPGSGSKGEFEMDLFDRFAGNDSWHTRKLLEAAATLPAARLDEPLDTATEILPWREKTDTLRNVLENIVYTKEVWAAALTASQNVPGPTPKSERTPRIMMERLERADADLLRVFGEVGAQARWDETFVDALCEPPETFTFGGVFAHIMTFNGHRRLLALDALKRLGADIQGFGDPMEYEQSVAPWNPDPEKAAK
jgi:AraC family transcriptional regulator